MHYRVTLADVRDFIAGGGMPLYARAKESIKCLECSTTGFVRVVVVVVRPELVLGNATGTGTALRYRLERLRESIAPSL